MAIAFSRVRAFGRSNAGSAAVEFAIVAPILFVWMFAFIEFGRASDAAVAIYAANQVYDQTVGSSSFSETHPDGATSCVKYSFNYSPWFVESMG